MPSITCLYTPDQWNRQASKQSPSGCKHWLYLILIPLGSKDFSSLSSWRRSTTWMHQVPVHRESLWAGQESLKCDSRMCLLEYCHWKPLNWKLFIEKSSLEQPKENVGVWVQWGISKFIWNSDASTKTHMETGPAPSNLDDHGDQVPCRTQVSDRQGI